MPAWGAGKETASEFSKKERKPSEKKTLPNKKKPILMGVRGNRSVCTKESKT